MLTIYINYINYLYDLFYGKLQLFWYWFVFFKKRCQTLNDSSFSCIRTSFIFQEFQVWIISSNQSFNHSRIMKIIEVHANISDEN